MNPLLQRARLPGATFALPSKGLFYVNGELDPSVVDGEVHVYPLTTIDEIELKTPDLLFSGKAIDNVIKRCVPSILKPLSLTTTDVDFLLVCLRLVSYGPQIEMNHTHNCVDAKEHTYAHSVESFIHQAKMMTERDYEKEYVLKHTSGFTLRITPLRYDEFISFMTDIESLAVADPNTIDPEAILIRESERLASNIDSVESNDGIMVTDKKYIAEWIRSLTVKEIKEINDKFTNQSNWGCNTIIRTKCKDCGADIEIPVTINPIDFFTWS